MSDQNEAYFGRKSRFWTYTRESTDPKHRWIPWLGSDEWGRRTLVLPIPFAGYLVTALWWSACDEACLAECVCCDRLIGCPERQDVRVEWDDRLDGYCHDCALIRCDAYPGAHRG